SLVIKSRDGADLNVKLAANGRVTALVKATLGDVKPNDFLGVTSIPEADGSQRAVAIQIFAEAQRGLGEGSQPWDLSPNSTMTNGIYKTGACREQSSLLPPRIDDYVGRDDPVRAIEVYVCGLDLGKLGFQHADGGGGAGQPSYDPADLLKLYLYGYLNRVRSSRRLEREAGRNVELIWLLRGLVPGYRTIGNFRKDNRNALKAANRDFVMLARDLDLLG